LRNIAARTRHQSCWARARGTRTVSGDSADCDPAGL